MKEKVELSTIKNNDTHFITKVLQYYFKNGRHELPWRKNITPYSILVSEVMLQQTQVSRVLVKYNEWMSKYPSLEILGAVSLKEILLLWQGLGYQRRAKALHAIAQLNRALPATYEELIVLPGIGKYTASAICAFAYNSFSFPVLETNIRTVIIDEFHIGEEFIHDGILYDDLTRLEKNKKVRDVGARDWYYALMDYGAHLKGLNISHNKKSLHNRAQTSYKGSLRELRAKVLFSIAQDVSLPEDERLSLVIESLLKEKFIVRTPSGYSIV